MGDVLEIATAAEQKNRQQEEKRKSMDRSVDLLQHVVYKNANPHPAVVAVAIIVLLVGLYIIYIMFRVSLTGSWMDNNKSVWKIEHKWNGELVISNKSKKYKTKLDNNQFVIDKIIGIWNGKDLILLTNGHMKRIL